MANATDYALTAGIFSRSPAAIRRASEELRAGNVYVNRGITGAVVGRQPFGGFGMSGVGSKAGGPDYLLQFLEPRAVTENTLRQGFAPDPTGCPGSRSWEGAARTAPSSPTVRRRRRLGARPWCRRKGVLCRSMAGATGEPIGPFPEGADPEEYDKLRRRVLWTMPYGLYVVGCRSGDRRNLMTLNWATQVSFDPKLVGIGVDGEAVTHQLITEGRAFSLCLVDREDRAIVRKFVKPAEVDAEAHTLNGFAFRDGPDDRRTRSSSRRWPGWSAG